jgi:hypothetical protein
VLSAVAFTCPSRACFPGAGGLPYSSWQHIPLSPHDWGSCAPLDLTIARAVIGRRRPKGRCVLHVKGGLLVDS